jgi:hypothetical protein
MTKEMAMNLFIGEYAAAKQSDFRDEAKRDRMLRQARGGTGSRTGSDQPGARTGRFLAGLKLLMQAQL